MTYTFDFTLLSCQFCVGKIHCEDCGLRLGERLCLRSGIEGVDIDMEQRRMRIKTALDRDDVLDILEEVGAIAD